VLNREPYKIPFPLISAYSAYSAVRNLYTELNLRYLGNLRFYEEPGSGGSGKPQIAQMYADKSSRCGMQDNYRLAFLRMTVEARAGRCVGVSE
jgi:hypothetical protein